MKTTGLIKHILVIAIGSILAISAYRFGGEVADAGGVDGYLDTRGEASRMRRVMQMINAFYVDGEKGDPERLSKTAIKAMMTDLDRFSEYMDADAYRSMEEQSHQAFGGVGMHLETVGERLVVVAPIEGAPASRAGILSGDEIRSVDGKSLAGQSLSEAVMRIKGPPGASVLLGMHRPSQSLDYEAEVVREIIQVESVRGVERLSGDIGYLRITQFGDRTADEVRNALQTLGAEGPLAGLVIDLRNNPGGLLEAAVDVSELFLPKGQLILRTEGRHRESVARWHSENSASDSALPIAILINGGSASASEIVAGALKDTKRAILVGSKSFGKGSVQTILPIGEGEALRLTTAKYYTPGGYVIHERGIEPDIAAEIDAEEERKLAIQRFRLSNLTREEFVERFQFEPIEDRQLAAAVEALAAR